VETVGAYLLNGLDRGEAVLIIAEKRHSDAFEDYLSGRRVDLCFYRRCGRFLTLDAAETLESLMTDGQPSPLHLRNAVGARIQALAAGVANRRVRVFGEMVALLARDARHSAALRLEQLWNELSHAHNLSLRCAYPVEKFAEERDRDFYRGVCAAHTHVIPVEQPAFRVSYAG
jgi:hypothetical protein